MCATMETVPDAMRRTITPVEDRIDEMIEKLQHLKRLTRRPHDVDAMRRASDYLGEVEKAYDRVEDAVDEANKEITQNVGTR